MEREMIKLTIPTHLLKDFNRLMEKASRHIEGLEWEQTSEPYNKTYRHYFDGEIAKFSHNVVDVEFYIPAQNGWHVVATIKEGVLFVTNHREKLELHNGHGLDYCKCDCCGKHQTNLASYIIRHEDTGEELQLGKECAKKYGVGTAHAIYSLTNELYESYSCGSAEDDFDMPMWNGHISDPYSCRSVEASVIFQAAKKYYDENDGKWIKGYYTEREYVKSESAETIKAMLNDYQPNDDIAYFTELKEWINTHIYVDDYSSDFERSIAAITENYYFSAQDVAPMFFAIKKYESWKKEEEKRKMGLYVPKRDDYIYILGDVISANKRSGYFGDYIEYEIKNEVDGLTYKRAGKLPKNAEGRVEGYAYVGNVWNNTYTLERVTKGRKKGIDVKNMLCKG